ncbi:hypothetical protein O181_016505 [Austropuccinia psidii MF-1]|uniref:Uncharacterized protein n=1 Tax=Austropuccinia psidii MF-1 TaxID=1389203 RepID=A0A9Q3C5Z1_9BASI|nr:hypothetical protein [Austropuccinia psidii MF-1]
MPIQHSPPARQTTSQSRAQAFLTPTTRAPLDCTPAVPQLRAQLDKGPHLKGEEPSRKEVRGPRRSNYFSVVVFMFPGISKTTCKGPAQSNQPVSHQSEPSLLAIMQEIAQIMANLQEASFSEASRPPAFKNPSMKAQEWFGGTHLFKVRSFIHCCQLIFYNDPAYFSQERKKGLYATSFLIGKDAKWIEPYLSNLTNKDPNYLLNSWKLFESQLFSLFGDLN